MKSARLIGHFQVGFRYGLIVTGAITALAILSHLDRGSCARLSMEGVRSAARRAAAPARRLLTN
jgi:hypothetical protein